MFTSLGDAFGLWTRRVPRSYCVASKLADVNYLTGMGYVARQLARQGICNLVLMPNGCCQVRFSAGFDQTKYSPEFDAVFVGSRIPFKNPLSHFFWTAQRVESLLRESPSDTGGGLVYLVMVGKVTLAGRGLSPTTDSTVRTAEAR